MLRRRTFSISPWFGIVLTRFSGHDRFEESTEEIAPLTEEEKKQKLQELREALAEKRAKQSLVDKEEQKKNEVREFFRYPSPIPRTIPVKPLGLAYLLAGYRC
jgi:hypothetical protein